MISACGGLGRGRHDDRPYRRTHRAELHAELAGQERRDAPSCSFGGLDKAALAATAIGAALGGNLDSAADRRRAGLAGVLCRASGEVAGPPHWREPILLSSMLAMAGWRFALMLLGASALSRRSREAQHCTP